MFVINYDEWGGFFDHVPPNTAPIPEADRVAGNRDGLRGFRTPCLVISPFAQREHVAHLELDHTSILRMIEWRWSLKQLTVRDETAGNLADVLNFAAPALHAKQFKVPAVPFGRACFTGRSSTEEEWLPLLKMAKDFGWAVT